MEPGADRKNPPRKTNIWNPCWSNCRMPVPREAEEIKEELQEEGWLQGHRNRKRKKHTRKPQPETYFSSEGIPILVGRNNKQNDFLTHRIASPTDTWLHTKEIPGSHVVIRGKSFGEATLHEAAMLAAWHSKARESSQVPVDYTLIKHVKKPSGTPPGFVIYEEQKTLYVTPEDSEIRKLKQADPAQRRPPASFSFFKSMEGNASLDRIQAQDSKLNLF